MQGPDGVLARGAAGEVAVGDDDAGRAVNEVARIAAMCRSAERSVLVSAAFAEALAEPGRARLVSVGRYALRGVRRPQELFTLDTGEELPG